MKQRTYSFCNFFYFLISILTVILLHSCSQTTKQNEKMLSIMTVIQGYMMSFETNIRMRAQNEGVQMNDVIVESVENKEHNIRELLPTPKIILRYSFSGCATCIFDELELLRNDDRIDMNNVYVLLAGANLRMLKIFSQQHNSGSQVLLCNNLPIPFDNVGKMYVFVLDSTLVVHDFFIPNNSAPNLSKWYYDAIYEKYFTTN